MPIALPPARQLSLQESHPLASAQLSLLPMSRLVSLEWLVNPLPIRGADSSV